MISFFRFCVCIAIRIKIPKIFEILDKLRNKYRERGIIYDLYKNQVAAIGANKELKKSRLEKEYGKDAH